jgi:hypothetical protein
MGTRNNQHQGDVSSALVRPAAAIFFVMRPILVCLHPKAGMAFLARKSPFGAGGGVRFSLHRGPQERSIPDMVQCLLDNLNG